MSRLFFLAARTLMENDGNILAQGKNTLTKNNANPLSFYHNKLQIRN
jgi:hypothetical protein